MTDIQLSLFDPMEEKQVVTADYLENTITFLENRTTFQYMNELCQSYYDRGMFKEARAIAAEFVLKGI